MIGKWISAAAVGWSRRWYERLAVLFVALVVASVISVFEGYWWEETYSIAYWTIGWTAAVALLLPYRLHALKLAVQAAGALYITYRLAGIERLGAFPESGGDRMRWIWDHAVQLHPFIWISLSLLAVSSLFGYWATDRIRIFGFLGAAILVLTIADSFTPIWLWDNVAAVVLVGLVWLVANHFSVLQAKHPDSWKELLEYPVRLVTPMLLVVSALMLIGISMPSVAPVLQDPYTLWKNARGERVQVYLGEKAIPSESDPASARIASSGYSRNDEALGGGFNYDYSPIMTVSTSHKSYWRGESKDMYTGKGWVKNESGSLMQPVRKDAELDSGVDRSLAETVKVDQIVTMLRDDIYPVLFAAAPVSKVNWVGSEEAGFPFDMLWSVGEWELIKAQSDNPYPDTYAVTSEVALLDEAKLRGTRAVLPDRRESDRYLQLPDSLPGRVRELAEEVTAAGETDYDKARLLETYLSSSYTYTNQPDLSKLTGGSADFVDQFLFELMEGYCDYFSTTMAVMARSVGLPARWVKGFSSGALPVDMYGPPQGYFPEGEDYNPNGSGTYTVRNSDAHSWVEIYFEGYGWVPFEPTAGFAFPYRMPAGEETALPEVDLSEPVDTQPAEASASDKAPAVWGWAAAVTAAAAVALILVLRRQRAAQIWREWRRRAHSPNDLVVLETHKLLKLCKKRGLARGEHETMRESLLGWAALHKRLRNDFVAVADGFEQAKYGSRTLSREEADRFAVKVRSLMEELR